MKPTSETPSPSPRVCITESEQGTEWTSSGYFRVDANTLPRTNLAASMSLEALERQLLMARAAKPLLMSAASTLLIVDSNERVLVGEGPGIVEVNGATLSSAARDLRFTDQQVERIRVALRGVAETGEIRTLEDWAPPLKEADEPYTSESRRIQVYLARLSDNGDPKPIVACLFHDVTELIKSKFAEERIQKERLHLFLGSISDAVLATDRGWRILYMNPCAASLLEITEEAHGKELWTVANIQDCLTNSPVSQFITAPDIYAESLVLECKINVHQEGCKIVSLRVRSFAGTDNWEPGYVVVMHDITEDKRRSQHDIQSRKMEAIGQLAAGIAHEINTPMQFVNDNTRFLGTSLQTLTDLIVTRLKEDDYDDDVRWTLEELPNAVKETREGIDRVIKIVSAMKEFSHPSGGAKALSDLNGGVTATTTVARNAWKYSAHLELNLADDLPSVFCNLDEINQVILNLVLNAVDAIKDKQQQTGSTELGHIVVATQLCGNDVVLSVHDDGIGVPDNVKARMFDPFFTTKPVGKGTGQGLAVTHDVVVNKHGGRVEVESEVGKGTRFDIYLPYAAPQEDEK